MNNEIREKLDSAELLGIKNFIDELILKLYKEKKLNDAERIGYELKIMSMDKYSMYKVYEILTGKGE